MQPFPITLFGGGATPPSAGNSIAAFRVDQPSTIGMRGSRSFPSLSANFALPVDSTQNRPLCLSEDPTFSKFFISWWMRVDYKPWLTTWTGAIGDNQRILGVYNSANTRAAWYISTRNSSSPLSLQMSASNGGTGTSIVGANRFLRSDGSQNTFGTSVSATPLLAVWRHCVMWYDGSQADDPGKCHFWIDGVQQVTPAGTNLPAKFGIPLGSQNVNFQVNDPVFGAGPMQWSIQDLVICASLPATEATAVADLYNSGYGRRFATYPASCPTPLAYYQGDDNANYSTGVAPSGNMVNNQSPGTYNLPIVGPVAGSMEVETHTDAISGAVAKYGYTATSTSGRRSYNGVYLPTGRNGKPCIYRRPAVVNTIALSAYAVAAFPGLNTAMGAAGSLLGNAIVTYRDNPTAETDLFTVFDDTTGVGTGGTTIRNMVMDLLSYNTYSNPRNCGVATFTPPVAGQALVVNCAGHGLNTGDLCYMFSTAGQGPGFLPAPLNAAYYYLSNANGQSSAYFARVIDVNTLHLAEINSPLTTTNILSTDGSPGTGTFNLYSGAYSNIACNFNCTLLSAAGTGTIPPYNELPIGREYNHFGIELNGIPLSGATYPAMNTEFTLELANNGNGQQAINYQLEPPGPYEMYIGLSGATPVKQPGLYHDDGGAGMKGNIWGATYANLSAIGFGCVGSVSSGSAVYSADFNEVYQGSMVIVKNVGPTVRGQLRQWVATN